MRKAQIVSSLFVLAFILIAGVMGANQANAVVCPAGLICIPKDSTLEGCPPGYVCVQNPAYVKPVSSSDSTNACYRFTKNLGELDGSSGYESTGADVVALQSQLIGLGFDIPSVSSGGSARGQFDEDTKNAVMKYQASKGIPSTGYFGPLTRASLNGLCNSSVTGGQSGPIGHFVKAYYNNRTGKIDVSWIKYVDNFDYYQIVVGNTILYREIQLGTNIAKSQTSYSASVPTEFANFVRSNEKGLDTFYVKVNAIKSDAAGGSSFNIGRSELFMISSGTSPSPTPSSGVSNVKILSPRGGEVYSIGNTMNVTWNTGYGSDSTYVSLILRKVGTSSYFPENSGNQAQRVINVGNYEWKVGNIEPGEYVLRVVCEPLAKCPITDSRSFKIVSTSPSPTPTPTNTPAQPAVSFTYPRYAETWYLGETKNVSWTYSNFDSYTNGDKFVELQLIPQDGRAPVVLGTYTAPYGYQPLTIYTKTSTGRDAWLPGEYKLRLVCRATNIAGFRNCRSDAVGYITVKAPMPTPTSTPVSVNPSKDLNAAVWSAVEEYSRGR